MEFITGKECIRNNGKQPTLIPCLYRSSCRVQDGGPTDLVVGWS